MDKEVKKEVKEFKTESGIEIKQIYGPADVAKLDYKRDLGDPGDYPFVRGLYKGGYRDRLWMFRQITGHGSAKDSKERAKFLAASGGVSGEGIIPVSIYQDNAGHLGLDSDDPMAQWDFGRSGVAMNTLEDMEEFLSDFDLRRVHINLQGYQETSSLLAMYLAIARKRGVPPGELRGGLENEVFGSYIYCKEEVYPVKGAVKLALDATDYVAKNMPKMTANVFADTSYMAAGASPVQSAAIILCTAMAFVEAAIARGMKIDEFADSLSFYFGTSRDFFEQIARLRAFRRLWARMTRERYGAKNPRSSMARIVVRTNTKDLTSQQPLMNVIRGTYEALAAVLCGIQSLTVTPFDEPICLPTDQSSLLSLRTQHILAEESGVINTVDPLGGSYFVESLTNEVEARIMDFVKKIEAQAGDDKGTSPVYNGVVKGVENGFFDREMMATAWELKQVTESGKRVVVGFNKYVIPETKGGEVMHIHQASLDGKIAALKEYRKNRDQAKLKAALAGVTAAAKRGENTIPAQTEAFLVKATLGEVMTALKGGVGAYQKLAVTM